MKMIFCLLKLPIAFEKSVFYFTHDAINKVITLTTGKKLKWLHAYKAYPQKNG
jgi:hypothetical protein